MGEDASPLWMALRPPDPPPRRERGMLGSTSRRFASAMRSGGAFLDLEMMGGMDDENEAENGRRKLPASADRRRRGADIMVMVITSSLCAVVVL